MAKLIQPHLEKAKEENLDQVRRDTIEKAITAVKNKKEEQSTESGE